MKKSHVRQGRTLTLTSETIRQLRGSEIDRLRHVHGASEPDLCGTGSHAAHTTCGSGEVMQ